ncbi:hypothetical protein Trydic_g11465 [Trypoxylus dichotomus]
MIGTWEHHHDVIMPEDMKNFYYSSNGFLYQWSCAYGSRNNIVIGKIEINSIENLRQLAGYRTKSSPSVSLSGTAYLIRLGYASKVYEITTLENNNKVCLVYLDRKYVPTIWLCTHDMKFHFLADSFTKYFCMAITHLGVPNWQMLYIPEGVPKWSAGIMHLLSPGVLLQNRKTRTIESMRNQRILKAQTQHEAAEINVLDPKVFFANSYRQQLSQSFVKKEEKVNKNNKFETGTAKKRPLKSRMSNRKLVCKAAISLKSKKVK